MAMPPSSRPSAPSDSQETQSASRFFEQLAAATPATIRSLLDEACVATRQDPEGFAAGRITALWHRCLELAPEEAFDWFRRLSIQERFFWRDDFFRAWKAMDPKAGSRAEQVYEDGLRSVVQPEAITALLDKNPLEAFDLALDLPIGPMRAKAVERALLALMLRNPDEAFKKLIGLQERQEVGGLAKSMMKNLAESNLEVAKQSLKLFPEGRLREEALRQLAGSVRDHGSTEEAVAWIRQLPPGHEQAVALAAMHGQRWDKTLTSFFGDIAKTDPQLAVSLFDSIKEVGPRAREAATGLYRVWHQSNPTAALEWAMRQPAGMFGEFSDHMLKLMKTERVEVLTKLGVPSGSDAWLDREAVMGGIRKNHNIEAARLLGSDGGLTYADRLMELNQGMEVEAMKALLTGWPPDAFRSGVAARFASRVVAADPAAAIEFASAASEGLSEAAFSKFAKSLAANAPLATSQWLEIMPPGNQRDAVIRELTPVILADGDPTAAFQWSLTMTDEAERIRLAAPAFAALALADPSAATAALESPKLKASERAVLQPLLPPSPPSP